jgi:hypothetical protein
LEIYNSGRLEVINTYMHGGDNGILSTCQATITGTTISDTREIAIQANDPERRDTECTFGEGELLVRNSTLSGNQYGAYIVSPGGLRFRFEHVTIANNAIGISTDTVHYRSDNNAAFVNSIVANSSYFDCTSFGIPAQGTNLDSDGSCSFTGRGHLHEVDPQLEPLTDNGGSTPTHRLREGSPAIDSALDFWCTAVDQRGVSRPIGGGCDIGAYEAQFESRLATPEEDSEEQLDQILSATVTPEPVPITINFNADSYTLTSGECTRLRWAVENADEVQLEGEPVPATEAEQVCPTGTTTYQLTAGNAVEQQESFVTIEVSQPAGPPSAPTKLSIGNRQCSAQAYSLTLEWKDNADDETGYRIYREGQLIATLGANAESYSDDPPYGGPYQYGVEAYNDSGASSRPTVQEAGCIF